jgi:hypothetical protein
MKLAVVVGSERTKRAFATWVKTTLDALVDISTKQLSSLRLPPLYSVGVYRSEPAGEESFVDAETFAKNGFRGDCAHLSVYRCAELRNLGEKASCCVRWKPSRRRPGTWVFHVRVRRSDGTIEDPSRILGM